MTRGGARETTGLIEYLQSPEALRNRAGAERRIATRGERRTQNSERQNSGNPKHPDSEREQMNRTG